MDALHHTIKMFFILSFELTFLFLGVSMLVGVIQAKLPPARIQKVLGAQNGHGYWLSALFGAITPFCSCSTIPFLKGLLRANAGFGPTMTFLFASPLLNPIIIGLFTVTFGIDIAATYFGFAFFVSIIAGWTLNKLRFERYIIKRALAQKNDTNCCDTSTPAEEPSCSSANVVESSCCATPEPAQETNCCGTPEPVKEISCCDTSKSTQESGSCGTSAIKEASVKTKKRIDWRGIWGNTWADFKQVLPYLAIGVVLGAIVYGYIPAEIITKYAGGSQWWAIPVAAVIGIPLYLRAEAIIPLAAILVKKGMAMGSVMALIIGSAGASITELILLKSLFRTPLMVAFVGVVLTMAIATGYFCEMFFA